MDQAILAEDLSFAYPAETEGLLPLPVFEHLTLKIKTGSFVAVLGRNGSGKSTLAKHFNAILLPSGGKVYVFGLDTSDEDRLLDVRRTVGMVFQNPDNQIVATIVEEDVAFAPENLGGMYDYRLHAPHLLSGGQKQRIAIAGVIAMRPDCVVLDEATAMLDPRGREEVMDTILHLNRDQGITVVLITHHMSEAARADRVIVMDQGDVLADGPPEVIFSQVELLRQAGLEVPDTTALCWELNQRGFRLPLDALSVEDCAQALYAALSK